MKAISISALILATTTSILAAPSPKVSALEPLQLTNLNAAIPSTTPPQTCLLSFAVKDPNTNTDTKCSAYWYVPIYGFRIPYKPKAKDMNDIDFYTGQLECLETRPTTALTRLTSSTSQMESMISKSSIWESPAQTALRLGGPL